MFRSYWRKLVHALFSPPRRPYRRSRLEPRPRFRPFLESLEDRLAPATLNWIGTGPDLLWSDNANWKDAVTGNPATPNSGDLLVFKDTNVGSGGSFASTDDLDPATTSGLSLQFNNASTTSAFSVSGTKLLNLGAGGVSNVVTNGQATTLGVPTLQLGAAASLTDGSTAAAATLLVTSAVDTNGNLLAVGGTGNVTLSGTISGTGGLTKSGTGTLIVSGNSNAYSGATTVNAGTLEVDGSLAAASAVQVNAGATLDGGGTIPGPVSLNGGTLAPGTSPATLTVNNATFTAASTFQVNLSAANVAGNQLVLTGGASLGNAALQLAGSFSPADDAQIVLIHDTGTAVTGTFNNLPEGSAVTVGTKTAFISYAGGPSGKDVTLTVAGTAVFNDVTDNLTLKEMGTNLVLTKTGTATVVDARPLASVTGYQINAKAGSNVALTLDFSNGFFSLANGVQFTGGGGSTLVVTGGTFSTVTDTFTGSSSGTLLYQDASNKMLTVTYAGLTPVDQSGSTIADLVLKLPTGTTNSATLQADPMTGKFDLVSTGTFENTTFSLPSHSVTINGGTNADTVSVNLGAANFNTALTIQGGGATRPQEVDVGTGMTTTVASLSVTAAAIKINGAVTSAGNQSYNGPVTLVASANVLTAGTVAFSSTVNGGGNDLHVASGSPTQFGNASFGGVVSNVGNLTVDGTAAINTTQITTSSNQNYNGAVTLGVPVPATVTLTAAAVNFKSTLTGGGDSLTVAGDAEFDNTVSGVNALFVTKTATLAATIGSSGSQEYQGQVFVKAPTELDGTNVVFDQKVDAASSPTGPTDLAVNVTGTATLMGAVGSAAPLNSLTIGATGTAALNAGSVATVNDQNYKSAVTLGATTTLTVHQASFASAVNGGGNDLHVASGGLPTQLGNASFGGNVSNVGNLTVDGATLINTSAITSSGIQTYGKATATDPNATTITLTADVTLTGSTITFYGKVVGSSRALAVAVTAAPGTGNAVFGRAQRGTIDDQVSGLSTLSVAGTTTINTSAIASTGTQTYGDKNATGVNANTITLAANTTLTGSTVTFDGQVVKKTGDPDHALTITADPLNLTTAGNAIFGRLKSGLDDTVTGVSQLSVAGTTVFNTTTVTTSDSQTYGNASFAVAHDDTIQVDALTLTAGGIGKNITFVGPVDPDAAHKGALTVNASGDEIFQGRVGGKFALATLITDAAGPTTGTAHFAVPGSVKTAPTVTTVNGQTYNNAVALDLSTVLTTLPSGTGNLLFNKTVNSASAAVQPDFTLTAAKGNVLFQGAIGNNGATRLGTVEIVTATNFTAAQSLFATALLQDGGTATTTFKGSVNVSGAGGIDLTTNAIVFDPGLNGAIAATKPGATVRLTPQGGVAEVSGTIQGTNLLLEGNGSFSLNQTANQVSKFAANVSGPITLGDVSPLTIDAVGSVAGVTTGNNPLAINFGNNPGGGGFTILQPVSTGSSTITATADLNTKTTFDVEPAATLTAGTGATFNGSNVGDTFTLAPSTQAAIFVNAGLADTAQNGDALSLLLDNVKARGATSNLTFTNVNGDARDGFFAFAGFGNVNFRSIENLDGLSVVANATQVSNNNFSLGAKAFLTDRKQNTVALVGLQPIFQPAINSFILSPAFASPGQNFSAPRVAVADVRGNGVPDLIIANGPGGPPLVTVLDSTVLFLNKQLDNAGIQRELPSLETQFFAFDPNFRGGVWVAAGDLYGTGRAAIVVGLDAGGPAFDAKVKIFANVNPNTAGRPIFNQIDAFDPYPGFTGGVRLAVGPSSNRRHAVLVASPGFGTPEPVLAYAFVNGQRASNPQAFFPYGTTFGGGISIGVGDYHNPPLASTANDLVVAPNSGVPQILVYLQAFQQLNAVSFQEYNPNPVVSVPAFFYDPNDPNQNAIRVTRFMSDGTEQRLPASLNIALNELSQSGVSGVAFGDFDLTFGSRRILIGSGIGNDAMISTLTVNVHLLPGGAGRTTTIKHLMLARMRTPGGVNVGG